MGCACFFNWQSELQFCRHFIADVELRNWKFRQVLKTKQNKITQLVRDRTGEFQLESVRPWSSFCFYSSCSLLATYFFFFFPGHAMVHGIAIPHPGIESALQGGFSTTGSPGKSPIYVLKAGCYILETHSNWITATVIQRMTILIKMIRTLFWIPLEFILLQSWNIYRSGIVIFIRNSGPAGCLWLLATCRQSLVTCQCSPGVPASC